MEYRYISREETQLKTYKCHLKTKITSRRKAMSYTGSDVDKIDCEEEYIGESSRTFEERYKEHQKAPSPIHEHQKQHSPYDICGEL